MISERLGLRVAKTLAKPTRRHLRPKRRCEIGSMITEPAIKCGTPEQTLPASPFRRTPSCRRVRRRVSHHDLSGKVGYPDSDPEGTNAVERVFTSVAGVTTQIDKLHHRAVSIVKICRLTFEHAAFPVPPRR